ncbi:hypothetical protein O6H91_13G073400 [Diphasiastrum complanatum]|uniref:Uncharacterized protein n=1 Tax=Diphasiastrum complanatum TaxID=34168 RepID=A0ACC2BVZ7_DIPCM|nr:hypothetical protein O6H91_13G073400 [Diphasiastrum complanatum]
MFGTGFKAAKCKTVLRLAIARIKLLRNKRDIQLKQMRRDIAQLLQTGQEPSARIRAEHVIREQNIGDAYDIIELFCEVVVVRLPILEAQKVCPLDLKEAVSSLIYVAPRAADLPELLQLRSLFASKYGKEYIAAASELRPECGVNRLIISKLSLMTPSGESKLNLLKEIAADHKLEWDPVDTLAELLKKPEDLLDGPKCFTGATNMPSYAEDVEDDNKIFLPKTSSTHSVLQGKQQQMRSRSVLGATTSVENESDRVKQFVPSVLHKHEKFSTTSYSSTPMSQQISSPSKSICISQRQPGSEDLVEMTCSSFAGVSSREAATYRDFASAVHAAAESAEHAAAAARTAASLAHVSLRRNLQ